MLIRSRMGISADGFVSTAEGVPTQAIMPEFVPGVSHGFPEFIEGCDAVVMGRNTFVPALGAPGWPWPNLQVFVLTSRPLPANAPADVITAGEPAAWPRGCGPAPAPRVPLRLLRADRTFPDGSAELVYAPGEPDHGH